MDNILVKPLVIVFTRDAMLNSFVLFGFSLMEELNLSDPDKKTLPEYDHYLARVLRLEVSQGTMIQTKKILSSKE